MRDSTCLIITAAATQQLTFNEHHYVPGPACSAHTHLLLRIILEIGPAKPRDSTISQGQMARQVAESEVQPQTA